MRLALAFVLGYVDINKDQVTKQSSCAAHAFAMKGIIEVVTIRSRKLQVLLRLHISGRFSLRLMI